MVLEDRFASAALEDRFASATLEDRSLTLTRRSFAYAHSKNFKALRADLQGLCPIFKPKAIFKGFARSSNEVIFKPQAIFNR